MTTFSKVQRLMTALGIASVLAAVPLAHAQGAVTAYQYVTSTSMHVPAILSMFMHKKDTTTTATMGPTRTRMDQPDGTTTIVACDTQQLLFIDNNKKTYYATSFDDMMKSLTAGMNNAAAQAAHGSPPPAVNGTGSFTISVDEKKDDQTQVIAGITAHHAVDTITMAMNGTGDCPSGTQSISEDVWYAPMPYKMSCPVHPKMPSLPTGGHGASSACMQNFQMQANQRASAGRLTLRSTVTMGAKPMTITTVTEVKSAGTIPYDPSFFNVPAG
ncbi:MAG TPA: hypothetical protein VJN22_08595, partial [Candidatus Eremiobacteraceae bacterium]|nr:hypothetical protein [Candidatus Eremiobacteraceae bacterium]